ncbi:hypothetical protein NDU88_006768 [Pleurodeles waltl]|uniref:Uncharacterized protein n=1 Tax=Pleurodeles waltl TaxID=8319 RepID=A0AAV7LSX0_PLEWA|nr:hypothetical protein NDU88_006768 [Pleurodeles waltl]
MQALGLQEASGGVVGGKTVRTGAQKATGDSDRLCAAVRLCEVLRGLCCLLSAVLPVDSCDACHALCCLLGAFFLVRLCQSLGPRLPMKASKAYDCC